MVTDGNQTYCGDHFEMYSSIKSLCCVTGTNAVLQVNYTWKANKLIEKEVRFVITGKGGRRQKWRKVGQEVQTPNYMIHKDQGWNIQLGEYN